MSIYIVETLEDGKTIHVIHVCKTTNRFIIQCIPPSVVPTATPQSLGVVAVSATVLLLTWYPPPEEQQNGIIQYYIINGTTETGEHFQLVSNTTALRVSMNFIPSTLTLLQFHQSL